MNKQTLEKAITKAIENGWLPYFATFDHNMKKDNIIVNIIEAANSVRFDYQMKGHIVGVGGYNMEPFSIIYDHDFAKALWGDPAMEVDLDGSEIQPMWQYHLQEMVIADDPVAYLGANI